MSSEKMAKVRGLVLDRGHRVLLDGDAPIEVVCEWPARPLAALTAGVRERYGLKLPYPAGSRVPAGRAPRDFAFLIEERQVGEGRLRWCSLVQALQLGGGTGSWIWETYVACMLGGWAPPTQALDVFFFGADPETASRLAHMVVCGEKRATAGWKRGATLDGITVPQPGLVSIVTDGFGMPRCAIFTEEVKEMPLCKVDAAFAAREAEGDHTLADWMEGHADYFRAEAASRGLPFDEGEVVFLESFRVLHVFGAPVGVGGAAG